MTNQPEVKTAACWWKRFPALVNARSGFFVSFVSSDTKANPFSTVLLEAENVRNASQHVGSCFLSWLRIFLKSVM